MADRVGEQLGKYRLIRLLGRGGFADVYLGEHEYLKTHAAVKVLHTQLAEDDLAGFLNEARTVANLKHPNIVGVLDFDVVDSVPFLVMAYAPNGSLRKRHPKGSRLPLDIIVPYTIQAANALQYAHDQKLTHCDIKPENMLLGNHNEVLLGDFGVAVMTHTTRSQQLQQIIGTAFYMAPEQVQGKPGPASDQYALAIVVYEWLTGDCPFQGSFHEIVTQHMFTPPKSLRAIVPTISAEVEEVVLTALTKDPQERFLRVEAFANAFWQASQSVLSMPSDSTTFVIAPSTAPTRISTPSAGNLPTVVSSPIMDYPNATTPAPMPISLSDTTSAPVSITPPIQPQSERRISRRMLIGGLIGVTALSSLAALAEYFHIPPFPGSKPATRTVSSSTSTTQSNVTTPSRPSPSPTPQPTSPPPSPTVEATSPVVPSHLTYQGPAQMYTVSWSPNGTWIASGGSGPTAQVWAANSTIPLFSCNGHAKIIYSVVWSPDGKRIATGHSDGTVQIWDAANGTRLNVINAHNYRVNSVAWSADSTRVASGSADRTVKVWEVATSNRLLTYTGHAHFVNAVAWSPDNTRIVSGGGDHTAQVWDANSRNQLQVYTRHTDVVVSLAWSPLDSARIVSVSNDRTGQVWDATSGSTIFTYTRHTDTINSVAWAPDGTRIASGSVDTTVRVWGSASGNTLRVYTGHTNGVEGVVWSPDSTLIASASDDSTVQVWRAT